MSEENKNKILHTTREGLLAGIQRNKSQLDANANFESDAQRAARNLQWAQFNLNKEAAEKEKTTIANILGLDAKNMNKNNSKETAVEARDGSKFYWKDTNTIVKIDSSGKETLIDANSGNYLGEDGKIHNIAYKESKSSTSPQEAVLSNSYHTDGRINADGKAYANRLFESVVTPGEPFNFDKVLKDIIDNGYFSQSDKMDLEAAIKAAHPTIKAESYPDSNDNIKYTGNHILELEDEE